MIYLILKQHATLPRSKPTSKTLRHKSRSNKEICRLKKNNEKQQNHTLKCFFFNINSASFNVFIVQVEKFHSSTHSFRQRAAPCFPLTSFFGFHQRVLPRFLQWIFYECNDISLQNCTHRITGWFCAYTYKINSI